MKTKRLFIVIFVYLVIILCAEQIDDFWIKTSITSSVTVILLIIIFGIGFFAKKNLETKKTNQKDLGNILSMNRDNLKQR